MNLRFMRITSYVISNKKSVEAAARQTKNLVSLETWGPFVKGFS